MTKHLRVLAKAGLVRGTRQGRESRWQLNPEPLELARRYLDRVSEQWTQRLEALERHLDSMDTEVRAKKPRKNPAGRTRRRGR